MILYTDIVSPDDLPELGSDLVAALAGLQVDDLSHGVALTDSHLDYSWTRTDLGCSQQTPRPPPAAPHISSHLGVRQERSGQTSPSVQDQVRQVTPEAGAGVW